MSLRNDLIEAQKQAMKSGEADRLSVLRMLYAAIRNAEIDKKSELTDEEIHGVVGRQVKQLKDALVDFEKAGRQDLVEKNQYEISLLESYLPEQMSDEELQQIVNTILQSENISADQVGAAIGRVMKEVKGKADGSRVRECVNKYFAT